MSEDGVACPVRLSTNIKEIGLYINSKHCVRIQDYNEWWPFTADAIDLFALRVHDVRALCYS